MYNYSRFEEEFEFFKVFKDYIYKDGSKKILISCPHAVFQTRNGKTKAAEVETAYLALALNQMGYPCFIKTSNVNDDANFDYESKYKNALLDYSNKNDIKYIIDLHELAPTRTMDIDIATGGKNHKNMLDSKSILKDIVVIFQNNNLNAVVNEPYSATGDKTISSFASKNGIPAIQVEINLRCISQSVDGKKFENVLKSLKQVTNTIERNYINEKEENSCIEKC